MDAKFKLSGDYYIHVGQDQIGGTSASGASFGGFQKGTVALQLFHKPLPSLDVPSPPDECVVGFLVKPSEARAIASALLSAATEARA